MTTSFPLAFAADHELKPLPFDPVGLDGLSEKLIRSHWENNYGGSVKALNAVKQRSWRAFWKIRIYPGTFTTTSSANIWCARGR